MPKGYNQLTYPKRCQISVLLASHFSQKYIASLLHVSPSTISRECKRNRNPRGYKPESAHAKAMRRRTNASSRPRRLTYLMRKAILFELEQSQASPVQISGNLQEEGIGSISHESIYRMLRKDKKEGGTLYLHLRRRAKKYKKRLGAEAGVGLIPGRVDIDQRPKMVEEKQRFGDFEIDTIMGANHQGAIVSVVDRASKWCKLALVPSKEASHVTAALLRILVPLKGAVRTLTADNGKEFAKHAIITQEIGAAVYFAHPYKSWQRGLNEHTNGLVRQYFPKGTNFKELQEKDVQRVEKSLNSRPRKILNFKRPSEVAYQLFTQEKIALQC